MSLTRPIILSRPDRVGDAIIASACFVAVKARHPEAPLYYLAREVMRPLFGQHPLLAGFLASDQPDPLRLREQLQRLRAGVIVHLQPDVVVGKAAAWAEIPEAIGYEGSPGTWLTQARADTRALNNQHERDNCFDLLRFPPLDVRRDWLAKPVVAPFASAQETVRAQIPAGRFVVVNPGAHSDTLRWPAERFAELIQRIESELALKVLVIGAQADDPSVRQILKRAPGVTCLAGRTDLAELAWLMCSAALHISRDTGTAHLASAVGCPVLTLFGRTEPEYGPVRWAPLGPGPVELVVADPGPRRWYDTTRAYWRRGFAGISVERVMERVRSGGFSRAP